MLLTRALLLSAWMKARLEGLLSSQAKECDILQLPGSTEQLMQPDEAEELTTLTHLEIGWCAVGSRRFVGCRAGRLEIRWRADQHSFPWNPTVVLWQVHSVTE